MQKPVVTSCLAGTPALQVAINTVKTKGLKMFGKTLEIPRSLYDLIMETASFNHAAPAEDLTRTQDLSRWGWCKVHNGSFRPYGHCDRVRLVSAGVCESCDYDLDKWRMRDQVNVVRINGQHYMYGDHLQDARVTQDATIQKMAEAFKKANPPKQGRGFGGDTMIIQFNDGRTVITNDLWHQGEVPALVADMLPDNACSLERV